MPLPGYDTAAIPGRRVRASRKMDTTDSLPFLPRGSF